LIWPAMLMADARHSLPETVIANNFINFRMGDTEAKVSKSKTAQESPVWIEEYLKRFDPDALRYYLTAIAPETSRTAFDPADFVTRNNGELVAAFGNFVNRTLQFAGKYFDGKLPDAANQTEADKAYLAAGDAALIKVGECITAYRFRAGLDEMMTYARMGNEHFSNRAPWASRKVDMDDCAAAIATCVRAIQYLAVLCYPFMPGASKKMFEQLNQPAGDVLWTAPHVLETGHQLGAAAILFEKLDADSLGSGKAHDRLGE
jgi:methionyl-tRNA synthetase